MGFSHNMLALDTRNILNHLNIFTDIACRIRSGCDNDIRKKRMSIIKSLASKSKPFPCFWRYKNVEPGAVCFILFQYQTQKYIFRKGLPSLIHSPPRYTQYRIKMDKLAIPNRHNTLHPYKGDSLQEPYFLKDRTSLQLDTVT
ncbi:hypothetical protein TNCT_377701 [Trichonephila clavata]|uniref:Uncharacterized protein n=1 Tax=Trichonephila clavata TaxID=2740835 RepID=A0A8X6KUE6_TRICU|nr:hypothetical protein TNCT_377701 [Trichonephila clavata]